MAPLSTNLSTSRRYSINNLLHLQVNLPVPRHVVEKLQEISDLHEFIRIRASLADVTNTNRLSLRLTKRKIGNSSSASEENEKHSAVNLKRDQRVNWYLRQRESSDLSAQPHSAPVGFATQQAENFQRFYRAVVSPTHVRVTAGGRIVPNTRSSTTAPPEWNAHKLEHPLPLASTESTSFHPPTSSVAPQPVPASFLPRYTHSTQRNAFALTTMASQSSEDGGVPLNLSSDCKATTLETLSQPIKISPPSQFDQSKPFIYNGQVVYPLPPGVQPPLQSLPVPFGVLGNPNFAPPQLAAMAPLQSAYFPFPIGHLSNAHALSTIGQHAMGMNPGALTPDSRLPSYTTSPSLQSVSELTKHQLQMCRSQLKFIENQLANNKHQIDENYMEHQRRDVLATIETMESMLEFQLAHDLTTTSSAYLRGSLRGLQEKSSAYYQDERSSATDSSLKETTPMFVKPTSIPVHIKVAPETSHPKNKIEDIKPSTTKESLASKATSHSEIGAKSRLSAAAAKAPPFQPRAKSAVVTISGNLPTPKPEPISSTGQAPNDPRFMSKSTMAWGLQSSTTAATNGTGSLSRAHALDSPQSVESRTFQRYQTFHGVPAVLNSFDGLPLPTHSEAVPYLVGVLPHGINPTHAASMDLIYQRDLTADEIRARFLYWGKAPRSAYAGLPKFDGKDFYPPSPTKEHARSTMDPSHTSEESLKTSSSSVMPLDFESLFMDSPKTFKTTTPARIRPSLHNIIGTPSRLFLDNGLLGSPSPRSSKHKYNPSPNSTDAYVTKSEYVPATPSTIGERLKKSVSDDFSHLFLERGETGYKPVSPVRLLPSAIEGPRTPERQQDNVTREGIDTEDFRATDSWGASGVTTAHGSGKESSQASSLQNSAAVSIKPVVATTKAKESPSGKRGNSCERVNLSSVDQQSQLLQRMLRNTTLAVMSAPAPALSGMVSSTTAHGYLPVYRGSAAASLTPTMADHKINSTNTSNGISHHVAASPLPENRPLNVDGRSGVLEQASSESMGAEAYMRYLSNKANNEQKIIDPGWNANTNATGPVMGSDW